jgi:hypothetical protein
MKHLGAKIGGIFVLGVLMDDGLDLGIMITHGDSYVSLPGVEGRYKTRYHKAVTLQTVLKISI